MPNTHPTERRTGAAVYTTVSFAETIRPLVGLFHLKTHTLARAVVGIAVYRDLNDRLATNYHVPVFLADLTAEQVSGVSYEDDLRAGLPDEVIISAEMYGELEDHPDGMPAFNMNGVWQVGA